MDDYMASSARNATAEDVATIRRTLDAHQRHLDAHDSQLASGGRMFEAIERHLTNNFQLVCLLWLGVIAAIVLAVAR